MIANSYLHNILLCVSWKLERETEEKQRRGNTPCSIMTFRSKLLGEINMMDEKSSMNQIEKKIQ